MALVVSDTSPIRALGHLGRIDLLRHLYTEVLIPPAVVAELRAPASGMVAIDVHSFPFLQIRTPTDREKVEDLRHILDLGESEALALALEVRADLVLIDESAGRSVAMKLGLIPIGVLGILVRSKQRGDIAEVTSLIDRLQNELRFFISPKVRSIALRSAGESS